MTGEDSTSFNAEKLLQVISTSVIERLLLPLLVAGRTAVISMPVSEIFDGRKDSMRPKLSSDTFPHPLRQKAAHNSNMYLQYLLIINTKLQLFSEI